MKKCIVSKIPIVDFVKIILSSYFNHWFSLFKSWSTVCAILILTLHWGQLLESALKARLVECLANIPYDIDMKYLLIFVISFGVNFVFAEEDVEICAGTFQSFWKIESSSNSLQIMAFYKHPEDQFCEKSMTQSPNAEISILDSSKNLIRKFKTYLSTKNFQDVKVNNRMAGAVQESKSVTVQIKFADDAAFKKAKFLKINFSNGSSYGPSSF